MRSIFLGSLTLLLPVWTWHVSWGAVYVALNTQNKTLAFYTPKLCTFYRNQVTFNYLRASILRYGNKRFFMSIYIFPHLSS
jgi:hypothetical protein